ncbi:hypothetical protein HYX16_04565 [Candidatus Woesearchaeota archaeon]|nr:hypothetical protein [Candidatus Woesearchaeota archaeon]
MISLGLFITFQNRKFQPAQDQFFNAEACRLSVLKASQKGLGVSSLDQLNGCKTQEITSKETDKDKVHELLTNNLDTCWAMFGRGKINFLIETGEINKCFICSSIKFENNVNVNHKTLKESQVFKNKFKEPRHVIYFEDIKENKRLYSVILASNKPKSIVKALNFWTSIEIGPIEVSPLVVPQTIEQALNILGMGVYFPELNSHLILTDTKGVLKNCQDIA